MRRISLAVAVTAFVSLGACNDEGNHRVIDTRSPELAGDRPIPNPKLPPGRGYLLARVRRAVLVYDEPGGTAIARLRRTTPFGDPRTLGILRTDTPRWLAVHSPVLGNERVGWVENDSRRLTLSRTRVSLRVDLSHRAVELRRAGRVRHRFGIAIGRAGTATPTGRFQVTDKFPASRFPKGPYGCCIVALSARQPNLPKGWPGGDRIAFHGSPSDHTIGQAVSNGCLRATDADLRVLMRDVPVGAPVFIRP